MHITGTESSASAAAVSNNTQALQTQDNFGQVLAQEQKSLKSMLSIESFLGFTPEKEGVVTIEEIEAHAYESLSSFNTRFQSLLEENGIDTSQAIDLGHEYGSGRVIVTNDHQDKEKIEALFEDNSDLGNEYTRITGMLNLVEAGKRSLDFQRAYAIDPEQAVEDFQYLWRTHVDIGIRFENGAAEVMAGTKQNSLGFPGLY